MRVEGYRVRAVGLSGLVRGDSTKIVGRPRRLGTADRGRQRQHPEEQSPMPKTVPNLPGLEQGALPFSKVVEANGFVFVAGQIGDAPGSNGPVPGGIEAETRAMLDNVGRLLKAVGLD